MAIGNQLDLNIVINGFNQAQNALERLGGTFGGLGQSAVNFQSGIKNLSATIKSYNSEIDKTSHVLNSNLSNFEKFNQLVNSSEGESRGAEEALRDYSQALLQAEQAQFAFKVAIMQTLTIMGQMAFQFGSNLVGGMRESAIEMEQLKIQLKTIGDASEDTTKSLDSLVKISKLPGIDFQSAVKGVTQLRATGVSASLATESISQLGNALASVGADPSELSGVVRAFSQIQSKGKVYAEEIYQIAERLPQIRTIMLETIGTADTELLAKEGYSANRFLQLVTQGLSQLPRVANNTKNELSNLKNEVFLMTSGLGKQLLPIIGKLTKHLTNVIKWINSWSDSTKKWVAWGAIAITVVGSLVTIVGTLGTVLLGIIAIWKFYASSVGGASMKTALLSLQTKIAMAEATKAGIAFTAEKVALDGLTKSAVVATGATRGLSTAMKSVLILSGVGIVLVVAELIWSFLDFAKSLNKTEGEMNKLGNTIQATNEKMGKFTEIQRLTQDIKSQTIALEGLEKGYERATKALEDHRQKGQEPGEELDTAKESAIKEEAFKSEYSDLQAGFDEATRNRDVVKENLQHVKEQMYNMIKELNVGNLFGEFTGISMKAGKGVVNLKWIEEGKTTWIDESVASYNTWIGKFRDAFLQKMKDDLADHRKQWLVLNERTVTKQKQSSGQPLRTYGRDIQQKTGFRGNTTREDWMVSGEIEGKLVELEETQGGVFEALTEAMYLGTSTKVDTGSATQIMGSALAHLAGIEAKSGKHLINVARKLKKTKDGVRGGASRLVANINRGEGGDTGWAISRDIIEYDKDLKIAGTWLENEGVFDNDRGISTSESDVKKVSGRINLLTKTFADAVDRRYQLDLWLNLYFENQAKGTMRQKSVYKQMQGFRDDLDKSITIVSGTTKEDETKATEIWNQMTAIGKTIATLQSGQRPILVTQKLQELQSAINDNLKQENLRLSSAIKAQTSGSTAQAIATAYGNLKLSEGQDMPKEVGNMMTLIETQSEQYTSTQKMELERFEALGAVSQEGLNSLATVLIDEFGGDQAGGVEFINKVMQEYFMKGNEYNNERINILNNAIVANKRLGNAQEEFIKMSDGRMISWKLYDKLMNPAELFNTVQKYLSISIGGDQKLLEATKKVREADVVNNGILLDEMETRNNIRKLADKTFTQLLEVQPKGFGRDIAKAIISSGSAIKDMNFQIAVWEKDLGDKHKGQIDELTTLIGKEEDLLQTRIDQLGKEEGVRRQADRNARSQKRQQLTGLKEQQGLIGAIDPEALKQSKQKLKYEMSISSIGKRQSALTLEHALAEKVLTELKIHQVGLYTSIVNAKDDEAKYTNLIMNYGKAINEVGINAEEKEKRKLTLMKLVQLQVLAEKATKEETLNLEKQILKIEYEMATVLERQKRERKEAEDAIKRKHGLDKADLDISLQIIKNNNRDGNKNINIINKEYEIKTKTNQLAEDLARTEKQRLKDAKEAQKNELLRLQGIEKYGTSEKDFEFANEAERDKAIEKQQALVDQILSETDAWQKNKGELEKIMKIYTLLQYQQIGALQAEEWEQARKELDYYNDALNKQLTNQKRINKEVADQQKFSQEFGGIESNMFGFQNWDKSKFDDIKNEFKSFFQEGVDPTLITELKSMTQEYSNLQDQKELVGLAQLGSEEEKEKLLSDITQKELELYKKFNDNYRTYLNELKTLSQERFNNAKSHADQMLSLTEEGALLDLENEYAGRKMTPELESQKLQKELDIKAKFIQDKHDLDNKELEQRRGRMEDFGDYSDLTEKQKTWLRDKQRLNQETKNSYKQLENTAKSHNLRFSADATKSDKYNNKLGGKVLSYLDTREKRTDKHHATIESMERKHQREMQKYLDQDGQTLKDKADKYAQAQFKYGKQIEAINTKHSEAQQKSRLDLETALSSSHTGKGGMPVELKQLMRDVADADEAEKLNLPKTKEDFLKLMRDFEFKDTVGVSGWEGKIFGKLFGKKGYEQDKTTKKWTKKVEEYRKNLDSYDEAGYAGAGGGVNKLFLQLKKMKDFEKVFAGKEGLDHTKIAETLASFSELGVKPGALDEFLQGVKKFDDIKEKLEEKGAEAKMSPLELATKKATDNMNKFGGQLLALSGANGSLPRFGKAIDAVASKLDNLAGQLGGTPDLTTSDEVISATPVIVKFNVTTNDKVTVSRVETGVDPGASKGAGTFKPTYAYDGSRTRSGSRYGKDKPSTANTEFQRRQRMLITPPAFREDMRGLG